MNWRVGLFGLIPAAFAAAVVGAKLNAFDLPEGININNALMGKADESAKKPVVHTVAKSASTPVVLQEYK